MTGLVLADTLFDDAALYARYLLDGHLYAQVAAGYHDAVGGVDDLVDVVHALLVLYLRDDLDIGVVGVEDALHGVHVLGRSHEGVGYEVDVLVYGQSYHALVAVGESRQVDVLSRHVHALVRAQRAVVEHPCRQRVALFADYLHGQRSVVEEHVVAHLHVVGKAGARDAHVVVGRLRVGMAADGHLLVRLVCYGLFDARRSHLGSLGVYQQGEMWCDGPCVADDLADALRCGVGRVHSHDVHAGEEQMAKEVLLTVLVADGAYYFCLFHALSFFMLLQRYKKNV